MLWIVGATLTGVGALIMWNLAHGGASDSGPTPFLIASAAYGGSGFVMLKQAWRMHRRMPGRPL